MKVGKPMRIALDIALSVMLVLEMFIQFTGEFLHEVIGFAFFATLLAHLAFSAAWVKKTARNAKQGKLTARRTALAVIGSLLALTVVVLGVSSVAISGILSSAGFVWPVGSYAMWVSVHTFSAYALCALVVVHLAMHWAFLASAFKVPYSPSRRRAISTGVNAVAALGVLALGVTAVGKMSPQMASADAAGTSDQASGDASTATASGEESGSGSSSGAAASSGPSSGRSGKSGKSSGSALSGSSSGSAAPNSSSGSGSAGSASGSSGAGSANSGSNTAEICTICRKQCPLSAPKCNKPYQAGLL